MSVAEIPGIDAEVVELCDALNAYPGIQTIESCAGHGKSPIFVCFVAERIEDLAPILYWFDKCHLGGQTWPVATYTDCGMVRARFRLESPDVGGPAYEGANRIAVLLRNSLEPG